MKPLRIFVFSKPQSIPPKKTFVCVCVYGFCFNSVLFFLFICGFNICPEILWCPSVQEMECNSLPPECRLGLVIGLLWIKYGRGKIIILQWRSPVNTTSRLMSPGITHVDIITLEEHFTCVIFFPKSHNLQTNHQKNWNLGTVYKATWPVFFKNVSRSGTPW